MRKMPKNHLLLAYLGWLIIRLIYKNISLTGGMTVNTKLPFGVDPATGEGAIKQTINSTTKKNDIQIDLDKAEITAFTRPPF